MIELKSRLTIVKFSHRKANKKKMWLCSCECGNTLYVSTANLNNGKVLSCGCLRKEIHTVHGKKGTKEHRAFYAMKNRCYNKKHPKYKYYGGRGIKVHPLWIDDFMAFFNHIGEAPGKQYTVDRIDNNSDYEPGNVRWATKKQQANNRRKPNATQKVR